MHKALFKIIPLFLLLLSSCSANDANIVRSYLNYKYVLVRAGDLHGLAPTSNEVLDRNPGFTSYINLFDKSKSFINYQCKGTSYDDFYCEASFYLYDKDGNAIIKKDSFVCQYTGEQGGRIIYDNDETKKELGTIFVYTAYWCRWQFEYDVDNSGNKTLLTFEVWKNNYNPLPDFLSNEEF